MKALGAPGVFIPGLILEQAFVLAGTGTVVGICLFFPMVKVVEKLAPEVSTLSSLSQILITAAGVVLISLLSSIIPNQRLRRIYPLEVFR